MTISIAHAFLSERWHGKTSFKRLFWLDLLGVGTFVNLLFAFTALILLAKRVDISWGVAMHFLPVPYNLFLVLCVWRHVHANTASIVLAVIWLLLTLTV